MQNENITKAKEMFWKYCGVKQYMDSDGVLAEYEAFGIPEEQEELWKNEIAKEQYDTVLDVARAPQERTMAAASLLDSFHPEWYAALLQVICEGGPVGLDTYSLEKVYICLLGYALRYPRPQAEITEDVCSLLDCLKKLREGPITIDRDSVATLELLMQTPVDETYVKEDIQKQIEYFEKKLP